jgi:hypothetical protein
MRVFKQKILEYNDEDLGLIATADARTYPDEVVLAVWEELAARGVVVDFIEQPAAPGETPSQILSLSLPFETTCRPSLLKAVCSRAACRHFFSTTYDSNKLVLGHGTRLRQTARAHQRWLFFADDSGESRELGRSRGCG